MSALRQVDEDRSKRRIGKGIFVQRRFGPSLNGASERTEGGPDDNPVTVRVPTRRTRDLKINSWPADGNSLSIVTRDRLSYVISDGHDVDLKMSNVVTRVRTYF